MLVSDLRDFLDVSAGAPGPAWRTLRGVSQLDAGCERLVYLATPAGDSVIIKTSSEDLESLLEYVASEANHEDDRGKWRIFEMDLWDQEATDLVGPAYIEFKKDGRGELSFIAVQGDMDGRTSTIDGKQTVEFSWQGFDEGDEVSGRGWAVRDDDGNISGHIYFHLGDDSGFRARPW